eukprot:NODE_18118_length_909_cov_5.814578.p4 GENE.NODE_18118_length_909_cov_5.814578~~NODE_18118_length_909_cov_5.814578.p4  ORF type:complete len:61 (+),score=18.32 NODE_18118_length_909_cov_5.814578:564-746(+)
MQLIPGCMRAARAAGCSAMRGWVCQSLMLHIMRSGGLEVMPGGKKKKKKKKERGGGSGRF